MNYILHYDRLITRARTRPRPECYTEKHHIIPRCMGGGDEVENIAILTAEEHYVAHQLLVKIYPNNIKLIYAAHALSKLHSKNHSLYRSNNKKYAWLKRMHSEKQKTGKIVTCMCGDDFYASKFRLKTYKELFCTKKCQHQYVVRHTATHIEVPCLNCKQYMTMTPKYYAYTNKKFCTYSCRSTYNNIKRKTGRYCIKS